MPTKIEKLKAASKAADEASVQAKYDWYLAIVGIKRPGATAAALRATAVELVATAEGKFFAWQNAVAEAKAELEAERKAVESAHQAQADAKRAQDELDADRDYWDMMSSSPIAWR